jgi:hypothetical protein
MRIPDARVGLQVASGSIFLMDGSLGKVVVGEDA